MAKNDAPKLAPKNFDEVPGAALDYALWMIADGKSGIFIPAIIAFTNMGSVNAKSDIRRFACEDGPDVIDIGRSVAAALDAFDKDAGGDFDVVIHEGLMTIDGGAKVDCFIGGARNNLNGARIQFVRRFGAGKKGKCWSGEIQRL